MPVEHTLMENGRVTYLKLTDPFTVDEIADVLSDDKALKDQSQVKIHSIIDLSACRRLPDGILRLRNTPSIRHEMTGDTVIVGAPAAAKAIMSVFSQLSGGRAFIYVQTADEAWAYLFEKISQEDPTAIR